MYEKREGITSGSILRLVSEQQYRWALTGRTLEPDTASIDHILPITRGGAHDISNVWVVHHQANSAKGTMTAEEFIALCREVVRHQRRVKSPESPKAMPLFESDK